jgi:hypothetical protein
MEDNILNETNDTGLDAVKGIHEALQIDEAWSSWDGRGFEWWGHNLRQRVWSTSGYDDDGIIIYRIYAVSDCVRNVNKSQRDVDECLSPFNSLAVGSSIIYDPSEKRVQFWLSATVHEESAGWMTRLLVSLIILQAIEALSYVEILAKALDAEIDSSGARSAPDEMLLIKESNFLPIGQDPSPWMGNSELVQICEMLNQSNCFSTGDDNGLTAEFQFGDGTSMMKVVTDEPNPSIGSGVGLFLHLPMWGTFEDAAAIAGALNRAEANNKAQSHLIGSWCAKTIGDQSIPAFATFIPAVLYQELLLTNLVISAAVRAAWAGEFLNPDTEPTEVVSILMARFGVLATPNDV